VVKKKCIYIYKVETRSGGATQTLNTSKQFLYDNSL